MSDRDRRMFLSDGSVRGIQSVIEKRLGRQLTGAESNSVVRNMGEIDDRLLLRHGLVKTQAAIVRLMLSNIKTAGTAGTIGTADIKELLTDVMNTEPAHLQSSVIYNPSSSYKLDKPNIQAPANENDMIENEMKRAIVEMGNSVNLIQRINKRMNYWAHKSHSFSYAPVTLHTVNRLTDDANVASRTTIRWNFQLAQNIDVPAGSAITLGPNTLTNILAVECGTIMMPSSVFITNLLTNYRLVTMFIQEFADRASLFTTTRRYHFLFEAAGVTGQDVIKLTPIYQQVAKYEFDQPIRSIDTFTISFGEPDTLLTFGRDRSGVSNFTQDGVTLNLYSVVTSVDHGMGLGTDKVYITGFTTSNTSADRQHINEINDRSGVPATITGANSLTFTITIATALTGTIDFSAITVVFGSFSFIVPLKFRYMPTDREASSYSKS